MIDTERVAVFDRVEHLKEDVLDECVVPKITAVVEDLREQVVVGGVIHNNIGVVEVFHDAMQGDDTWVCGGELVEGDLADVDLALARCLMTGSNQAFHGV